MNTPGVLLLMICLSYAPSKCAGKCNIGSGGLTRLTDWTGDIYSPGRQSGMYQDSQDCTWEIKVARGSKIKLTFELFDLEPMAGGIICQDYVKINDSSGEVFNKCGTLSAPVNVMTSGDTVTVYFHSDESGSRNGFRATYTGVCESNITSSAVLATPNYPNPPPLGITCTWNIGRHDSLLNIIKTTNDLPVCGKSPLTIVSNDGQGGIFELCSSQPTHAFPKNITLVYNTIAKNMDVWVGEIAIDLTNDMNCSRFCVHSTSCHPEVELSKLKYNCVCQDGFEGITCEDKRKDSCIYESCSQDSGYCVEQLDTEPGSRIFWSATPANHFDTKPCPGGAIGEAKRNCITDPQSNTGGLWTRPNLSYCVSQKILKIFSGAQMFVQNISRVNIEEFFDIISQLVKTTNPVLNSTLDWQPLLPGDLVAVINVLGMLSEAVDKADLEIPEEFIKKFIQIVDNVVDPKATDIWRNALANLVETKIAEIIQSTQKFITCNVQNYLGLRHFLLSRTHGVFDSTLGNTPVFEIVARNLDIKVIRRKVINTATSGAFEYLGTTTSITFPGIMMNTSEETTGNSVNIYLSRFSTVSTLLSISESRFHKEYQNDSNIINSDVVSVEFLDIARTNFISLKQPVVLTFHLQDDSWRSHRKEQCVFMNMSAASYKDRWSTSGCLVAESNQTHVVCYCYHLTNFAVLMDVYSSQDSIDPSNNAMLTYISYVGGSLSVLACIITIVVFQYFKLSSDRIRIHQHLSLSIIFVQILFICMGKTGKEYNTPLIGCRIVATLLHYSLTSMFCWMLVEGTHLYIVLVRVFKQGSHFKKYLAVGWGIPLIIVGISIGAFHDRYGIGDLCWLDQEMLLICFAPTVGIVITVNTVILVVVIRLMVKSNNSTQKVRIQERNNISIGLKATAVLLPLLGLTWVFGFLSINTVGTQVMSYIFTYLFTFTNSFQGVLFFVFHCLLNVDVRQAFDRRYNRKKRLSYIETTSSRLRKLSEPEAYNSNNMLSMHRNKSNATLSILNNVSPIDRRPSNSSSDNGQILNLQNLDNSKHFVNLWPM